MNANDAKKTYSSPRVRTFVCAALIVGAMGCPLISTAHAQTSQRDAEILKKIQAIKKKADEAWAARKRSQNSREAPAVVNTAKAEDNPVDDAALKAEQESARLKAEQEKATREKVARAKEEELAKQKQAKLVAERLEAERKQAQLKAAARVKAEQKATAALAAKAEDEAKKRRVADQKAQEEKRIADATRVADQRRLDEQRRQQDEQRQRLEDSRARARQRRDDAASKADERRDSGESRGEQLQKDLQQQRNRATSPDRVNSDPQRAFDAEKRRQLEEERRNDWQRAVQVTSRDNDEPTNDNAARRAKADELAKRLRAARQSRSALGRGVTGNAKSIVENDRSVTILLIMDVGHKGVRLWSKTADPMVCLRDKCYLSNGPEKPSRELLRSKAFGPGVALGTRGLACRSSPACVFRHVDLHGRSASLQPVDLKFVHHDRRPKRRIAADQTCTVVSGRLTCNKVFGAGDWRAWVIPENVAEDAGPELLQAALNSGLK